MSLQGYVNSKRPLPSAYDVLAMLTANSDSGVEKVLVLTSDSRTLVGTLLSCDQMTNLVRPTLFLLSLALASSCFVATVLSILIE